MRFPWLAAAAGSRNRLIYLLIEAGEAERIHAGDAIADGFRARPRDLRPRRFPVMPSSVFNSTMVRKAYGACNPYEPRKGGPATVMECNSMVDISMESLARRRIGWHQICISKSGFRTMAVTMIGVALLGSLATAVVVEKAVLGAMFRAMKREKTKKA